MQLKHQQQMFQHLYGDKGINEATLELVRAYCRQTDGAFLIEDVAEHVGLAYQTVVRYLQHLHNKKELIATSSYGKVGRPRKKYEYVAGPKI
jgi:two-component system response regulator DctR